MNVVSRVGSLITQGVYSVATPFHPFGGAVDIIIVEQQDGTYRSTPWYVRFGKFQGVLKGAEKIVQISVNGIEADFHMYLDNSGEAYFIREESGNEDTETETNKFDSSGRTVSIKADITDDTSQEKDECNIEEDSNVPLYDFDENHLEENSIDSSEYSAYHYGSLNDVEDVVKSSENSNTEMVLVSVDGHVLTAPLSSNEENMENVQLSTPQFHLGPGESSAQDFTSGEGEWEGLFTGLDATAPECEHNSGHPFTESIEDMHLLNHYREVKCIHSIHENSSSSENVGLGMKGKDTFMSCLEFSELTAETECCHSPGSNPSSVSINGRNDHRTSTDNSLLNLQKTVEMESGADGQPGSSGKSLFLSDVTFGLTSKLKSDNEEAASGVMVGSQITSYIDNHCNDMLLMTDMQKVSPEKNVSTEDSDSEPSPSVPNESLNMGVESKCNQKENSEEHSAVKEECSRCEISGFEISLCGNLLHPGMGQKSANDAFDAHCISREEFESSGTEIIKNANLIVRFRGKYLPWDAAAPLVLAMAVFGLESSPDSQKFIPIEEESLHSTQDTCAMSSSYSSRRWRLWPIPFRRVRTLQHSNSDSSTSDVFVDTSSSLHSPRAESMQSSTLTDNHSPRRQFIRTNIPTTEQMASLKLRDGQNTIAFSFSTRVLGKQQVDAHVYLWKWNTRIVISDVDGTITKSDVLGQFMPLVGRDWTQSGVARLFSAIKENGYQLLFLSARAIVQAYLTRSFLLNLKQDGKALPNGPVVISPDGLFPSLYREVIRRAPHEFKIACLEDIRALFPSDYNPFYAGFGNRDTDELSYRKMGIPKGKIFIINPKGEVAINHCIEVKSYTSLHTLVNDMFPSTSVAEQEDFNSWNYWKMPLPSID